MAWFRKKKPEDAPAAAATPETPAAGAGGSAAVGAAGGGAADAAATAAPTGPEQVTVVDSFGRPLQLPREQWRKEVLPKMVEANARQPHQLAALVLQGLRDGLAADLLPAALRLAVVDTDVERSLSVLAAVQREAGDLDASGNTLRELQQRKPESPAARVGLALLRDKVGERAAAVQLLWEALQLDPNHPDALHGWITWEHQRVGDAGLDAVLDAAVALPNAWRVRLLRARRALEQGRADAGIAELRAVFAAAGDDSDALAMAAHDLQRAGRHDVVAELVLPRYRIERHHPNVGVLLLSHFAATRQPQLGEQLLHELRVRFPRMLDAQLARFDQEFARMSAPPTIPASATPPRVTLYRMDRPLWHAALGEPEWLLPRKAADAPRALFVGLSVDGQGRTAPEREDEAGRLSRAVPMFLAEQCWLASPVRGGVVIPVAEHGGWVVSAVPWVEDRLVPLIPEGERAQTRLVTGVLRSDGGKRRIDLWVYDCGQRQRVGHAAAEGDPAQLGEHLLQLLGEVSPLVGGPSPMRPTIGAPAWWARYATGQAQLAALVVAQMAKLPKDRVYGQRAILEWLLAVALEEPRWSPAKLALAGAMCADAAIGSHIHRELAAPFVELFRLEPPQSPFAKAAALVLRQLGLMQVWQERRAEIAASGDEHYLAWLQRIEQG